MARAARAMDSRGRLLEGLAEKRRWRGYVAPIPEEFAYEETIYFHPFVRDFLMGDGGTRKRDLNVRLLTRDDVKSVEVELSDRGRSKVRLGVQRVQLYLMKPCVGVLGVELSGTGLRLGLLQDFQDQFRRIYPPFWIPTEKSNVNLPGLSPLTVTWRGERDVQLCHVDTRLSKADCTAFTRAGGEPPVSDHWKFFFGELLPLKAAGEVGGEGLHGPAIPQPSAHDDAPKTAASKAVGDPLRFQQILDDRIPCMSYFAVSEPESIAEGDYDRLAFYDASNDSNLADNYPYYGAFLAADRADWSYDRFLNYGTKYLCSGYGMTVVGRDWDIQPSTAQDGSTSVDITTGFFLGPVKHHFRHHYYRMGMLAHYQRAALLYFADELASSIKKLVGTGEELRNPEFRGHLDSLQMTFLKFASRSFFREVSNQLQARDLWRFWWKHLRLGELFDQVNFTSGRLTEVLAQHETLRLTRSQEELAHWQAHWGRVGAFFVPISLALSLLSLIYTAQVLPPSKWLWDESHSDMWLGNLAMHHSLR